jgi:5'-deoxynucleotidase YfbR-like HD superfamily hydrolase
MRNNKLLENYIRESIVSLNVHENTLNEVRVFDLIMGAAFLTVGVGVGSKVIDVLNRSPSVEVSIEDKVGNKGNQKETDVYFVNDTHQKRYEDAVDILDGVSTVNQTKLKGASDLFIKLLKNYDGSKVSIGDYILEADELDNYLNWLFKNYGFNSDGDYIEEYFADLEAESERVEKEKENILMNASDAADYLKVSPRDPSSMSPDELQNYINEISASGGFKMEELMAHRAKACAELTYNDHASANAMSHLADIVDAFRKKFNDKGRFLVDSNNKETLENLKDLYKQSDLVRQADYAASSAAETIRSTKDPNKQLEAMERFDRSIEDVSLSEKQVEIYRVVFIEKLNDSIYDMYLDGNLL